MTVYIDASALLSWTLRDHPSPLDLTRFDMAVSSVLVATECARTLDRLRLDGRLTRAKLSIRRAQTDSRLDRMQLQPLDDEILEEAGRPMKSVVGALDAIHLMTALRVRRDGGDDLVMATHDAQLARAARLAGMEVIGA